MATKFLQLTLSRVDGPLFDGDVISVSVPGVDGEMQILAHHEALITPLQKGAVTVTRTDESIESFEIQTGTLEISHNHATILI